VDGAPLLSHVPFLLSEDGRRAELHLVRSNPICRAAPGAARIAVSGSDGYVSPDQYGIPGQVPTWKLNQNKPDAVRLAAADHMAASGPGGEPAMLAAQMRAASGEG